MTEVYALYFAGLLFALAVYALVGVIVDAVIGGFAFVGAATLLWIICDEIRCRIERHFEQKYGRR